jgi:DNA-binding transcriptional regulator LsrR (DeoR family)
VKSAASTAINRQYFGCEFSRRTVSLTLKLRRIETVIGVAAGQRVDAIYGAACGRLINMLVTDATTARLLLDCPNIQQS